MRNTIKNGTVHYYLVLLLLLVLALLSCTGYQKMNPPPDVDKNPFPPAVNDMSCWLATAANILAGAGYGSGSTVQQRADDIYADLVAHYSTVNRGWPDAALQWWLGSNHNIWTNNQYTVVSYEGTKSMYPWNDQNGPSVIGNYLRRCNFVGIVFSWPTDAVDAFSIPVVGTGGHATTTWGDNFGKGILSINPTQIRMTDSDRETGGDLVEYTYDAYGNPNPGGPNEGSGWYFDYSTPHPYLRGFALLEPTDDPSDNKLTQIVIGSYKIHQKNNMPATDLHYKVGTDVNILSYKTFLDWETETVPEITESQPQRTNVTVDWDLAEKPVPYCNWVTITTEFVLPNWNAIYYNNVRFTYPKLGFDFRVPDIRWEIQTPAITVPDTIPDVTGGYVIGTFDILSNSSESNSDTVVAQYRFVHQYSYNQSPEYHNFVLNGSDGYSVANIKFGHSYGVLHDRQLWEFNQWMTEGNEKFKLGVDSLKIELKWEGKLPYPKGMDVRDVQKFIREKEDYDPDVQKKR